ncbi:MAG: choice-of-anchor D domain-containing protein, partial [Vicinamibacteraceae bacterium]
MSMSVRVAPDCVAHHVARQNPGWVRRLKTAGIASAIAALVGGLTGIAFAPAIPVRTHEAKTDTEPVALPASLHVAVAQSLARDADREYHIDSDGHGVNPRHGLTLRFTAQGARIETSMRDAQRVAKHGGFTLRLDRFGRGDGERVRHSAPRIDGASVEYDRGRGLREWFVNLPRGVEQGWTVAARSAGAGPLVLELNTGRRPDEVDEEEVAWAGLVYRDLVALDAHGRELRSRWVNDGAWLRIEVDDAKAVYPVVIDPWVQRAKLVASDGATGDEFGRSVAISGDTAVVGARANVGGLDGAGAVYVFSRTGDTWSERQKLTASDGARLDLFGVSVAVDGDSAVVGANQVDVEGNIDQGAAYVFARSGDTWSEEAKLTASDGASGDQFGISVSVSRDRVLVGAQAADVDANSDQGAAYVFVRGAGVWSEQAKLTAADGAPADRFAVSVALDGDTALAGADLADVNGDFNRGAAYVFTRSGDTWRQQAKLTAEDGAAVHWLGNAVDLAGETALVGAPGATAAYVFTRNGDVWTEQQKLTAAGGAAALDTFGASVALDGATALVGARAAEVGGNAAQGAVYVFTRSGDVWSEQQQLTASDGATFDLFGLSVALDGVTAMVGASGNFFQGAAYVFTAAESALGFQPSPLDFGDGLVGTSHTISAALQNSGDGEATGLAFTLLGEGFEVDTAACDAGLPARASCQVSVTFTPAAIDAASATLTVESVEGATARLALSGTGVSPALTVAPANLDFGQVPVGATSGPMTAMLRNTGDAPATELTFSPLENGFTADTTACGPTLPADESCQISITFSPTATGAASGTLTVTSAEEATASLALSGTGVTPTLTFTPAGLAFGDVPLGTTGEAMTATLENTGDGAATALSFVEAGEGFEVDTSDCETSLAAGASCEVSVTFTPAAAGPVESTLTVESAEGATATLDLSAGTVTLRYDFAEGATGYFTTTLGLFNPDRTAAAHVQVRLLPEGSEPIVVPITLAPFGRESIDVNAALGDMATGVAAVVTSDRPIAPIRQMSWDGTTFGSTLESGAAGPSTTHYFAEGATTLWELFYLLSNDNDTPARVTIEYLRDDGTRIPQSLTVAAHARQSLWVNAVPGMESAQAGAIIRSDVPIAAERSMYFSAGDAPWSAGSSSRGAHAPDDTWYFAEGATDFFDGFLLLMNPDPDTAASVEVRYQLASGQTIPKRHVVPPASRRTILVEAEDPGLVDQLVAAMTVSADA